MEGARLLSEVTEATGLPNDLVGDELSRLLASAGLSQETLTLDDLREVLAAYLQDVIVDAKNSFAAGTESEREDETSPITSILREG